MTKQNSFTKEELLKCGRGEMFGEGNAQLPLPPMLMFVGSPMLVLLLDVQPWLSVIVTV
jgi:hypothetical protein